MTSLISNIDDRNFKAFKTSLKQISISLILCNESLHRTQITSVILHLDVFQLQEYDDKVLLIRSMHMVSIGEAASSPSKGT